MPLHKWFQLTKSMIKILLHHPWLLFLTIIPNIITPAIEPIKAWIAQNVLDEISKGTKIFAIGDLLGFMPIALLVFGGLAVLKLFEKITNRMLDERLLIDLQRIWFERRHGSVGEQVTRCLNDCENARKVLDLFQKELWAVIVGLPAVIIWQLKLASHLLPALLVASVLPFLVALLFGKAINRHSQAILQLVAEVGTAVGDGIRQKLHHEQEALYYKRVKFEWLKQGSEVIADFAYWLGLVIVLSVSVMGWLPLLPTHVTAGEIGGFLINLKLISKPLSDIVKVYNKLCEGMPAVERALG